MAVGLTQRVSLHQVTQAVIQYVGDERGEHGRHDRPDQPYFPVFVTDKTLRNVFAVFIDHDQL